MPSFTFCMCKSCSRAFKHDQKDNPKKRKEKRLKGFTGSFFLMCSVPAWLNHSLIPVWPFCRPNGRSSARLIRRFCCRLVQKRVMERMTVPASDEWLFVSLAQGYRIIRRSDGASHIWETHFTDRIREEVNTCREGPHVSLCVWMNLWRNSLDGRWSVLESWKNSGEKTPLFWFPI